MKLVKQNDKAKILNKAITIRTLVFWGMVVLVVFMFLRSCSNFGGIFGSKTDTISIKRDTVWLVTQGDTVYTPVPYSVTNTIYKPLYKTDTLEITEVLPTDTAAILSRFYQKVFYSDTQTNKYGKIVIDDTIYRNRIASRRIITDMKIPEVTNTVTLVKNRNVVYFGVSAVGSPTNPLYAVGGDISLKSRNAKMYSIGAFTTKEGTVYYQAGVKIPIRLIKQK